jgi:hypothetical protein
MTVMGCAGRGQVSSREEGKAMAMTAEDSSGRRGAAGDRNLDAGGMRHAAAMVAMQFTDK